MNIQKEEFTNRREPIAQRRLREFAEEREWEKADRQPARERETHIQIWLLVLKLLFEVPTVGWTADDKTMAEISFRNLQKSRMKPCDARDEADRLRFLYQDYLKKTLLKA